MKKFFYFLLFAFAATNSYSQTYLEFAVGVDNPEYNVKNKYFSDVGISYKLFSEKLMLSGIYTSNYYEKYDGYNTRKSNIYSFEVSPRVAKSNNFSLYVPFNFGYYEIIFKNNDMRKGLVSGLGIRGEWQIKNDLNFYSGFAFCLENIEKTYIDINKKFKLGIMFKL